MTNAHARTVSASGTISADRRGGTPVTRLGEWTFTPASASFGPRPGALLQQDGMRVDLRYSSCALEEFVTAMARIQTEFSRLADTAERHPGFRGEQIRPSLHV
ncbi:hypothetical protein ACWEFL_06430 [Streptomyces sp. NPDC004838]